jgi:hypothetical protein
MNLSKDIAAVAGDHHADRPEMISREDLDAFAWSEPMSRLSQHFGLSDVRLAKACTHMSRRSMTRVGGAIHPTTVGLPSLTAAT